MRDLDSNDVEPDCTKRYAEGTRKPGTCQWCHSPIWIVYHGPNANQTHEPRGACEDGTCWAQPLSNACDYWKAEVERLRKALTAARDIFKRFGYPVYADACDDALEGD